MTGSRRPRPTPRPRSAGAAPPAGDGARGRTAARVLAALCLAAAVAAGLLLWQRPGPRHVDPALFDATRRGVEALYAYDHRDSEGSVQRKLDVLTGDLREQYEADLRGGIVDTYEQLAVVTRYEVVDVGLQRLDDGGTGATLVVFGRYVVESATAGSTPAPEGTECTATPEGAQSCSQTVQVQLSRVDDGWKIADLTLLTAG